MVAGSRPRMVPAAAALAMLASPFTGPVEPMTRARLSSPPPRVDPKEQERRAWERRRRKQQLAWEREDRLRRSIAEGKDDRPDKYLHAAARRRRASQKDV